jgi:ATP-dependent Clp protease, protease subunit
MDIDKDLLQARKIYLSDNIDNAMADRIGKDILLLNARDERLPIFLYINSDGGFYLAAMDIYDYVSTSKAPVIGIVCSKAGSMATTVLQACKKRWILKNSSLFLHNLKVWIDTEWDEFEELAKKRLVSTQEKQEVIFDIFVKKTGLEKEEIARMHKNKVVLDAKEALRKKLVDKII